MVMQPVGPESPDVYWRRRAVMLGVLGVALVFLLAMCARGGGNPDTRAAAATSSSSPAPNASDASLGGGLDDPASSAGPSVAGAASGAAAPGSSGEPTASSTTASPTTATATPAASGAPDASGAALAGASAAAVDAASAAAMDPAAAELSPSATPSATPSGSTTSSAAPGGACADSALRVAVRTDAHAYGAGTEPHVTLTVTNAGTTACTRDLGSAALSVVVTSGPDRIWSSDDCGGTGSSKPTTLAAGASWSTSVTWSATRSSPGHCSARVPAKPGFYQVAASAGGVTSSPYSFQLG